MKKTSGGYSCFYCSSCGFDFLVYPAACAPSFGCDYRFADTNCRTNCYNRAYGDSHNESRRN